MTQYGSVKVIRVLICRTKPRFGGESPKPPIGGRNRPPSPRQNNCSVFCLVIICELRCQ